MNTTEQNDPFIFCENAENIFSKSETNKATSYYGDISIEYLTNNSSPEFETGAREYQREKVAPLSWKQLIMLTVIKNSFSKIPQIHIRVIKLDNIIKFELIDGQQRVTSIIDFINGDYTFPNDDKFIIGNGIDVRGMDISDIRENYPSLYTSIIQYRISCIWYENLSDEQTADLFIKVLNNTNNMKPQEIRNAIRGFLSQFIRNTARFEDRNPLFERVISDKNKKQNLKHFSNSFVLNGRMEVDQWLSELIYLLENGYKNGVTQRRHTEWVNETQATHGRYSTKAQFDELNETVLQPLLKFSMGIIKSVPSSYKYKLSPMVSQILILYGYELKNKYGKLHINTYVKQFFKVYDKWSNIKLKLYKNEVMWGKKGVQMEPFNKLFGGKNPTAIGTITYVLDKELKKDEASFGVTKMDTRDFTRPQIVKKWETQNRKCFYSGEELELHEIVGDHYIPRSWGIEKGGVTDVSNLVVTNSELNQRKLNMHGDDFIKMLNKTTEYELLI